MSSSSINLSSILQAAFNTQSEGIDVSAAVNSALEAEAAPEAEWENEQATLKSQTSDLNSLETLITTLESSLTALSSPTGAINSLTVTSSDSSLVTAVAASGTLTGSHTVVVNNLATAGSWYSASEASAATALSAGSFQLQVGAGAATTITINSGDTLTTIANDINSQDLGVTASVITDSTGSRLAIESNATGSADDFTISNENGLSFTRAATGTDASLVVDGIPIDSASNTVTGAIEGVTLNLEGASPSTTVNLSIAADQTQVTDAVNSFVTAYNAAIEQVNTEYSYDTSTSTQGVLAGDSTLEELQTDLLASASYTVGAGSGVSTLADLGITMNNDGTLTVDSATLTNAVANNFSAVQSFLQGASSSSASGFASYLNTQLSALTDSTNGAFTVDLQSISSENTSLQDSIDNFNDYLATEKTYLTDEYSAAEEALEQLPTQESQIQAELGENSNGGSNS